VFQDGDYIGRPDPVDARVNGLITLSNFDEDFMAFNGNGGAQYATDSTFVIKVPTYGSDTLLVFCWRVTGWLAAYQGEG
jgi:hypothetical protein